MKSVVLSLVVFCLSITSLLAQSRISIAPTYWFNYSSLSYQVKLLNPGFDVPISSNDVSSSVGINARYHFTPKWDVSVGLLYGWYSSHLNDSPNAPITPVRRYKTEAYQLPVFVNYRLNDSRLSPYFSVGCVLFKNQTFTELPINVSGALGIGVDYRINSGLSLLVQPTASYLLTKPADDIYFQYTNYKSYSFGLQAQLVWHL